MIPNMCWNVRELAVEGCTERLYVCSVYALMKVYGSNVCQDLMSCCSLFAFVGTCASRTEHYCMSFQIIAIMSSTSELSLH